MLKLFAVKVWRTSEPRDHETIWVRTDTARRAQYLAIESYPGCEAEILGKFLVGIWHDAAHDD
jgi:hypothetical protein